MHEEQEITSDIINKYVNGLSKLSICTGKLDAVMLYLENNKIEDKFLLSSLESVLKDILNINGDKQYIRMSLGSHNINVAPKIETKITSISVSDVKEDGLNTKKVQSIGKQIKQRLNKVVDTSNNKITEYVFKNSTNLKSLSYTNIIKVRITFQNGRIYDYLNVPQNKIETLITCDKNNISPGKYFNSEIRGQYEYREVSYDYELIG